MKLALIPPRGLENYIHLSSIQLALAHIEHVEYLREYAIADRRRDFIILDNGIAEGVKDLTAKRLCVLASRFGADELVAPDVMNNGTKTLHAVEKFLDEVEQLPKTYKSLRIMAVAHSTSGDLEGAKGLVNYYADKPEIHTLGIPRCLMSEEHRAVRIDLANWVYESLPGRFEIHLLGTNPLWPREVASAATYAPHIRSVDTSMPFNYTIARERLDVKKPATVKRPPNYFDVPRDIDPDLLRRNITAMFGWVNAEAPVS